jgi:hypothetical protein
LSDLDWDLRAGVGKVPAETDEPQPGWKVSQDNGMCVLTSYQGTSAED